MGFRETFGKIGRAFGISTALFGATACEQGVKTKAPDAGHAIVGPIYKEKEQSKIGEEVRKAIEVTAVEAQEAPKKLTPVGHEAKPEINKKPEVAQKAEPVRPRIWKKPESVKPSNRDYEGATGIDGEDTLLGIEEITDFEEIKTPTPPPIPKVKVATKPRVTPPPIPKKLAATSNAPAVPKMDPPAVPANNIQAPEVNSIDTTNNQAVPSAEGGELFVENTTGASTPEKPSVDQEWDNIIDQWKAQPAHSNVNESDINEKVEDLTDEVIILEDDVDSENEKNIPEIDPSLVREIEENTEEGLASVKTLSPESQESELISAIKENRVFIIGLIAMAAVFWRRRKREDQGTSNVAMQANNQDVTPDEKMDKLIAELKKEHPPLETEAERIAARIAEQQKKAQTLEAQATKPKRPDTVRLNARRSTPGLDQLAAASGRFRTLEDIKRQEEAVEALRRSGSYETVSSNGKSGILFKPNAHTPQSTPAEVKKDNELGRRKPTTPVPTESKEHMERRLAAAEEIRQSGSYEVINSSSGASGIRFIPKGLATQPISGNIINFPETRETIEVNTDQAVNNDLSAAK